MDQRKSLTCPLIIFNSIQIKTTVTFVIPLLPACGLFAQTGHDLTIWPEDGLPFTFYANGQKVNESPSANVVLQNTPNNYVNGRIVFGDSALPPIEKKILQIGPANAPGPQAVVYSIVRNKKGELNLRWRSAAPKPPQSVQQILTVPAQQPQPAPGVNIGVSVPGGSIRVALPK